MTPSPWILLGLIVVLLVLLVLIVRQRNVHLSRPRVRCIVCRGTWDVESECGTCHEPIHADCWNLHLCKYRIN